MLYLRYTADPDTLWTWFSDYVDDPAPIKVKMGMESLLQQGSTRFWLPVLPGLTRPACTRVQQEQRLQSSPLASTCGDCSRYASF